MTHELHSDHFAASGGLALRRVRWSGGSDPSAVLALVHGFGEYVERYAEVARWFVGRGYRVYAYDQRGHGASEGPRTHAPSMGALLDDLDRFLASIRRDEGDRPLLLLGHSMGGLEVAMLLAERQPEVAGAVLSAPLIRGSRGSTAVERALVRFLSWSMPRLRLPSAVDPRAVSHDPGLQEAYRKDPRILKSLSARLAWLLLDAARRVEDLAERVRVPVLLLHGDDDRICLLEGSRRFLARLRTPGSELRVYPELRHEVLYEPERERVLEDVHAWVARLVASRAVA